MDGLFFRIGLFTTPKVEIKTVILQAYCINKIKKW